MLHKGFGLIRVDFWLACYIRLHRLYSNQKPEGHNLYIKYVVVNGCQHKSCQLGYWVQKVATPWRLIGPIDL